MRSVVYALSSSYTIAALVSKPHANQAGLAACAFARESGEIDPHMPSQTSQMRLAYNLPASTPTRAAKRLIRATHMSRCGLPA